MATPIITGVSQPSDLDQAYDIVIFDTNVLMSHPEFIPDPELPILPRLDNLDLNHKHLVIPSTVSMELNHLKDSRIPSKVFSARDCIKRMLALNSGEYDFTLEGSFELRNNLRIQYRDPKTRRQIDYLFSRWNVDPDIQVPPFCPSEHDADGKIIASALHLKHTEWYQETAGLNREVSVTILTSDSELCSRARDVGIKAMLLSESGGNYYSGRRTVKAPRVLSSMLIQRGEIPLTSWQLYLPNQPPLRPNEYIVFQVPQPKKTKSQPTNKQKRRKRPNKPAPIERITTVEPQTAEERFAFVGRYDEKRQAIIRLSFPKNLGIEPQNIGQAMHLDAIQNSDVHVVVINDTTFFRPSSTAVVSYRSREPALPDDIHTRFGFK